MRQDAQKQSRKFCRSKEGKNSETHPEKPEKGETGCVPGAGEGCSRYGRVGKPEIRTKMHQIAMQHMKKGNRRKPSVFAGFVAGAEGLVSPAASVGSRQSATGARSPLGTRFWSGCGRAHQGAGKGRCHPVPSASPREGGAGLVLRGKFRAKAGESWRKPVPGARRMVLDAAPGEPGAVPQQDLPLSFSQTHRQFGYRLAREDKAAELLSTEHDAFAEL